MAKIGILGGGSWGTALANLCAQNGHHTLLWALEDEVVKHINEQHCNSQYLPDVELHHELKASAVCGAILSHAELLLFAVPAQHMRSFLVKIRDQLPTQVPFVICSKGIERGSLATMDQVFTEELPGKYHKYLAVLSGPSFALEVARQMPTNVTVACLEQSIGAKIQKLLATHHFRIYTSDDLTGVELGGALKNVIAIAAGASDGLKLGNNSRAGLITRGLAEITRLAVAMGAKPETMLGLAGVGDLILTCTGELSRNRFVGQELARGKSWEQIKTDMLMVAEGAATSDSAYHLSLEHQVDMPITEQVYEVIHNGKTVQDALHSLLKRPLKPEWN